MASPVTALSIVVKPAFFASPMANEVVSEDAERFTMLLPISIVLKSFVGFSTSLSTRAAFLAPSPAIDFMRILLTVVRHVSADEKNAESSSRINNIAILDASLESK